MTHKQNLKKTKTKKTNTCNSLDGRFDKDFYYGFHKHQIA